MLPRLVILDRKRCSPCRYDATPRETDDAVAPMAFDRLCQIGSRILDNSFLASRAVAKLDISMITLERIIQTSGSLSPVTVTLGSIISNPARLFSFLGLVSRK